MAGSARKLWSRLSRMSWDELRTRVQQEVGKRMDAAAASFGVQPRSDLLHAGGQPGKFFFASEELPERVRLLKEHLPAEVETIIAEADEICQHHFRLLGYPALDYGPTIDWHLDAVHNKRTPLIPWYKINFLDFELAGDHKITWELNRHQHLVTLAKAWALSRDEKYAREAIAQWYSWRDRNPYPRGVNWASSLELAFRSLSWLWMLHLLGACPAVPADFSKDLHRALSLHGRHIERYLSTYFSPNTHLLGEAVALFFIGSLCPQISSAPLWKEKGWRVIVQESQRQVRHDGVYFEQSLHYHVYALDFFLHARLLASCNGVEIPSQLDDVIKRMLTVVQALSQVGPPDGFGDDDGGRVFNPRRNRAEHMTDPLAVGAAMYADGGVNASPTEESIWLFGGNAIPQTTAGKRTPQSRAFQDGGLYIIASADPVPQQMVIDAGPQGTGRSGHGHADALSVKLSFKNRPWLVDAGTFVYISPGNDRQTFRDTRAHNTLAVDGLDQAQPEGPFAWSALPETHVEHWITAETFSLFAGSHTGYQRLADPVLHRRFVFHRHGDFWLVRDCVEGHGSHSLDTSWHFAPDLELSNRAGSFLATIRAAEPTAPTLTLLPLPDPQWKCEPVSGEVSPAYGAKLDAPVVRCSAKVNAPVEHAMLLFPSDQSQPTPGKFTRAVKQSSTDSPAAYTYDCPGNSHSMIFGRGNHTLWTFGPWASDAHFLYAKVTDQKLTHLAFCGATVVRLGSECVFSHPSPLQYLEWTNHRGERRVHSSDERAISSLSETALQASVLEPAASAGLQR